MARFAEDDNLGFRTGSEFGLDTTLQLQHYRAGGVDDFYVVALGQGVCLRWLAMGTQQHLDIVQRLHLLMVDGDEPHAAQTFTLHAIVDNVAQTIECLAGGQFFFCLADGGGHAKAETTATVYFYLYHHVGVSVLKYMSSKSLAAAKLVFMPPSTACSEDSRCDCMSGLL